MGGDRQRDRATVITVIQHSDEFTENLVSKVPEPAHHHFTPKQQATYLKQRKKVRLMCNFDRLLQEVFIFTPSCHTGFSLWK